MIVGVGGRGIAKAMGKGGARRRRRTGRSARARALLSLVRRWCLKTVQEGAWVRRVQGVGWMAVASWKMRYVEGGGEVKGLGL